MTAVTRAVSPLRSAAPLLLRRLEYSFQFMGLSLLKRRSTPCWVPGMSIFSTTSLPTKLCSESGFCALRGQLQSAITRRTTLCADRNTSASSLWGRHDDKRVAVSAQMNLVCQAVDLRACEQEGSGAENIARRGR